MMNKKVKTALLCFFTCFVVGVLILIGTRMVSKFRPINPSEIMPGTQEGFVSLYKDSQNQYITFNKDGSHCYIYLIDKDEFLSVPNFTDNNPYCGTLFRTGDRIIYYESGSGRNVEYDGSIDFSDDKYLIPLSNLYYFNVRTQKRFKLYLPSEHDEVLPDTVVLSSSSNLMLIVTPSSAYLYRLNDDSVVLEASVLFKNKFEKHELFKKEMEMPYSRKPMDYMIDRIGEISFDNFISVYKDPRVFQFIDGNYKYQIQINTTLAV